MQATYCPRCAHRLEEQHKFGKLRQVCPECGYIHFHDPKVAAVVFIERVVDEHAQVLLVQRAIDPQKGRWALPAGFIDYGEDPKLAAAREVAEETGLHIEVVKLIDVYYTGVNIAIVYAARVVGGTLRAGDDAADAAWFGAGELPELAFESTQQLVMTWSARLNHRGSE